MADRYRREFDPYWWEGEEEAPRRAPEGRYGPRAVEREADRRYYEPGELPEGDYAREFGRPAFGRAGSRAANRRAGRRAYPPEGEDLHYNEMGDYESPHYNYERDFALGRGARYNREYSDRGFREAENRALLGRGEPEWERRPDWAAEDDEPGYAHRGPQGKRPYPGDREEFEAGAGRGASRRGGRRPRGGSFVDSPRYRMERGFDRPSVHGTNLEDFARRTPYRQDWEMDEGQFDRERIRAERERSERRLRRGWDRGGRQRAAEPLAPGFAYRAYRAARGPYYGIGPRGYTRSDERIHEEVCDLLTRHGALDARGVEVQVQEGQVQLQGAVSRREEKWLAEDLAEAVFGVKEVENRLRVSEEARGD